MSWDRHVGRRLKLRDLYILMAVVEARGMGKAANRLNMSQPAVSNAVADLERAIGARLLDRGRQGVEPTPYGRAIIKRGIAVFDELRQGVKDIEFLADPTAGELRIGCTEAMAAGPVLAVIDQLMREYPRIVFHVVTGNPGQLSRELTERTVELAISWITGAESEEHMVVEILFDDSFVVAAGMQNPLTRRRRIELAELVNEPWTLPALDNFGTALAVEAFRANGLKPPRATLVTHSHNMRNRLLAMGRFLTLLPRSALKLPGKHPSIKALPVELTNARGTIGIVTLRNRSLSPLAELFIKTMRTITKPLAIAQRRVN
jgi:DNA-binding transcriptional LysR family regulator